MGLLSLTYVIIVFLSRHLSLSFSSSFYDAEVFLSLFLSSYLFHSTVFLIVFYDVFLNIFILSFSSSFYDAQVYLSLSLSLYCISATTQKQVSLSRSLLRSCSCTKIKRWRKLSSSSKQHKTLQRKHFKRIEKIVSK